jgi:hypothetical protein
MLVICKLVFFGSRPNLIMELTRAGAAPGRRRPPAQVG